MRWKLIAKAKTGRAERRQRIIDAGKNLFFRNGLRGATMEAIAKEAGVAKPYGYFPDKEAVFQAVIVGVFDDLRAISTKALEGDGTVKERIARVLSAKFKAIYRILEGSPHADELYSAKGVHAAQQVDELERWLEAQIALVLDEGGHKEPHKFAQILIACADGIASKARHAEQIGPAIRLVVDKLLE